MTAVVLRGDARCLPLPDESVDLIITSPPYFGLRSYTDGGDHYSGQIGSEGTPAEYVAALLDCTREWCRVLKGSGSLWVNLGDKYSGSDGSNNNGTGSSTLAGTASIRDRSAATRRPKMTTDVRPKSLLGLPWRYALGCIDQLGLILRAEVIWSKPNGLPESVQDRVRRSHEQWFHFTRLPRYYSAIDEIREQYQASTLDRNRYGRPVNGHPSGEHTGPLRSDRGVMDANPLGKLPGSVWDIPSQPLTVPAHLGVDHFAAFPMELPRRIIQGWSPPGICTGCGEGRRPVADRRPMIVRHSSRAGGYGSRTTDGITGTMLAPAQISIIGYDCACAEDLPGPVTDRGNDLRAGQLPPTRPAVVLDPFGGTGTTALIATVLGRTGISVDRSADYCRLAQWRTTDPSEKARALQVDKPAPVIDGQGELFAV